MKALLQAAGGYIVRATGEDGRSGMQETPIRFAQAYESLLSGYRTDPGTIFKTFDDIQVSDGMVMLSNIEFTSLCEHHMLPFTGHAHIAYIPYEGSSKIVGVSKLARLFDCFAKRLQVQERIGQQVVNTLHAYIQPLGAMCYISAQHLCVTSRGVQKKDAVMKTSHYVGCFSRPEVRQEFFNMVSL